MIFLEYLYQFPNISDGVDDVLIDTFTTIPSFAPLLLLFVFLFVFITGMIAQGLRKGFADAPMWATLASISTLMITLGLTLKSGLVSLEVLAIVVTVTILSGVWLFLGKSNREI